MQKIKAEVEEIGKRKRTSASKEQFLQWLKGSGLMIAGQLVTQIQLRDKQNELRLKNIELENIQKEEEKRKMFSNLTEASGMQ